MHNDMDKIVIEQLYEKIKNSRKIGYLAKLADRHRNTVRNQLTGLTPLEPSMLEAATGVLAEVLKEEEDMANILKQNAPLLAAQN